MDQRALLAEVALGEYCSRQFKRDVTNGDGLAAEMAAFANAEGRTSVTTDRRRGSRPTT